MSVLHFPRLWFIGGVKFLGEKRCALHAIFAVSPKILFKLSTHPNKVASLLKNQHVQEVKAYYGRYLLWPYNDIDSLASHELLHFIFDPLNLFNTTSLSCFSGKLVFGKFI